MINRNVSILSLLGILLCSCQEGKNNFTMGKYKSERLSEFENKLDYLLSHQQRIPRTEIEFFEDSTFKGYRLQNEIYGNWSMQGDTLWLIVVNDTLAERDTLIKYHLEENCLVNEVQRIEDGLRKVQLIDKICLEKE